MSSLEISNLVFRTMMSQLMSWKPKKQWVLPLLIKERSQRLAVLQTWKKSFCPSILKRRAQRVLLHFQDLNKKAKSRLMITNSMPMDIFSNYAIEEQKLEERAVLWRSCFTLMIMIWKLGALAVQASNCSKGHCIKNPNVNYVKLAIHFGS